VVAIAPLEATGRSSTGSGAKASHPKAAKAPKASKPATVKASRASVPRTATGRIQRSDAARHTFARQTIAAGKAKDRTERVGCK
jgi:hypothetical protein